MSVQIFDGVFDRMFDTMSVGMFDGAFDRMFDAMAVGMFDGVFDRTFEWQVQQYESRQGIEMS